MNLALVWFRRDLRLSDNPALTAALAQGFRPVPVYIHAPVDEGDWPAGAASRVWLAGSLTALAADLDARGSGLVLRQGDALTELLNLIDATGARALFWNRRYEPAVARADARIEAALRARGLHVEPHNAALLAEPWTVATGAGGPYRVFTPFWRAMRQRLADLAAPLPAPTRLPALPDTVDVQPLAALGLEPPPHEPRWHAGFRHFWTPGEDSAWARFQVFLEHGLDGYAESRDFPDRDSSSRLSPHLHFGEISVRRMVAAVLARDSVMAGQGSERFLAELGWREFSYHLLHHFPDTPETNLNPRFDGFPWAEPEPARLRAWQTGRTGVPIVDAGMRQLWASGWMHNRVRMIVASFLCKNLRYHWLHGARWFWDTLVDADLANNTQGWQWSAGTGADAAPYFRVFNPALQAARFDPDGAYIRRWLPELASVPTRHLAEPWQRPDLLARHAPDYPQQPIVDLKASRDAALAAYAGCR